MVHLTIPPAPERDVKHCPQANEAGPGLCGDCGEYTQDAYRTYDRRLLGGIILYFTPLLTMLVDVLAKLKTTNYCWGTVDAQK